jgi:hypothetical protein
MELQSRQNTDVALVTTPSRPILGSDGKLLESDRV